MIWISNIQIKSLIDFPSNVTKLNMDMEEFYDFPTFWKSRKNPRHPEAMSERKAYDRERGTQRGSGSIHLAMRVLHRAS